MAGVRPSGEAIQGSCDLVLMKNVLGAPVLAAIKERGLTMPD